MTVSTQEVLGGFYNQMKAAGEKSISSDAFMEFEGFPALGLLCKQFPWPTIGPGGEIEVPMPMGGMTVMAQQLKTYQQGPVTFSETVGGSVFRFMEEVIARPGAEFNATVYEGTPDSFARAYKLVGCFFVPDTPDRDWENRSQITLINGTLHFNFFGKKLTGNNGRV